MSKKRRGTPPQDKPKIEPASPPVLPGHIKLGFQLLQKGWAVSDLNPEKAHAFIEKWEKRSQFTWDEIRAQDRNGLGSEKIKPSAILPALPRWMDSNAPLLAFRHYGNLAQVGIRVADIFQVVWVEPEYNTLYSHDGKNRR